MGIGYVIGCLLSVILWKIDRQNIFNILNKSLSRKINSKFILQIIYIALVCSVVLVIEQIKSIEISNLLTAFLVIDISNTEMKNLIPRDRVKFYDSISIITRSLVCGFVAPLFFIVLFGNSAAAAYMIIYNVSLIDEDFDLFRLLFVVLNIVPAGIAQLFLYVVYIFRNRKYSIDFKGDYLINFFIRPLLNVDILGAYIESVNFYYHYSSRNTDYLKSYGEYSKKIDLICVKDYLSIGYGICLAVFIIFHIIIR
jgi:hypothetical protein